MNRLPYNDYLLKEQRQETFSYLILDIQLMIKNNISSVLN